jgi:hypothetical protein
MREERTHRASGSRSGTGRSIVHGQTGHTLVAVLAVVTSALLIGMAIFTLGQSEGDLVEYAMDDARAFYIAEGGLERARGWLGDLLETDPSANPVGVSFENQTLGGGHYSVEVLDDLGGGWIPAYHVVCYGEIGGATRCVSNVFVPETFAKFQWFRERGNTRWLGDGDAFEGPVRVNGCLMVEGSPHFAGAVAVGESLVVQPGGEPAFDRGYEESADSVALPTVAELENTLKIAAMNGGVYRGTLPGHDGYYHVEFGIPSPGELTYTGFKLQGHSYVVEDGPTIVDIETINGALWFDESVAVEGVLDGRLTLFSDGDINIWDDVLYDDSTPGTGPDPGCDDVLGLIAGGDVVITYNTANSNDCEIHGIVMALGRSFEAESYNQHSPRGDFVHYGGVVVDRDVLMGVYRVDGSCKNGYITHYHWDSRVVSTPPPYFPLTGNFVIDSWQEVNPTEV